MGLLYVCELLRKDFQLALIVDSDADVEDLYMMN
jgi:hypothetical protein